MRSSQIKLLIAAVAALGVAIFGIPAVANATADGSGSGSAPAYQPAEYLAGVVFGLGPVAKHFPDATPIHVVVEDEAVVAEYEAMVADVIAEVDRQDPGFLPAFADAMASGDHVEVEQVLRATPAVIEDAFVALYPELVGDGGAEPACGIWVVCVASVAAAVALVVAAGTVAAIATAVVAGTVVAVVVARWFWDGEPPRPEDADLQFDLFVDDVATALAVR